MRMRERGSEGERDGEKERYKQHEGERGKARERARNRVRASTSKKREGKRGLAWPNVLYTYTCVYVPHITQQKGKRKKDHFPARGENRCNSNGLKGGSANKSKEEKSEKGKRAKKGRIDRSNCQGLQGGGARRVIYV